MRASVNTERKHAFIVRSPDLRKLWDLLQSRIGPPKVSTRCSDGIDRDFDTWKQVSSFDNPPAKKITHLTITSRSDDCKKSATIEFSDSPWRSIDIRIEGGEQVVSRLYDDVTDILDGIKPWYSRLTKTDFFYLIGFVVWFVYVVFDIYTTEKPKIETESISLEEAFIIAGILVSIIIGLGIVMGLLNRLWAKYFPVAYFALGQGENRYQLDEKIRWSIIVALVVSISGSIVVGIFQ